MSLRVVEAGQVGNGGLSKTGAAVVAMLALLGGTLLVGWAAATKYQTDLAAIREEQAFQGGQLALIMRHFGIPMPERRK